MRNRSDTRGFALPLALLVIVVLTVTLTAAFALASSESRVVDNTRDQIQAFTLAQSGLELFLVARDSLGFTASPPAAKESIQVTLDGGYATVIMEQVRPVVAGEPALYVVRSEGVLTDPDQPGVPRATRTVSQYARYMEGSLGAQAAWTALTGFHKNGTSGVITGEDACGADGTVAGMATATPPGYTQSGGGGGGGGKGGKSGGGGSYVPTGSPDILDLGPYDAAAASIPWDWASLYDGSGVVADIEIPGDPWPSTWPSDWWPVVHVTGNFSLPSSGQGTLIVTGDLRMNGSLDWAGLVLAGGHVTGNGTNGIQGAVFSGLNILLGDPNVLGPEIGTNDVGNGTKRIYYNSCAIANAMEDFNGLAVIPNAWADNWATY